MSALKTPVRGINCRHAQCFDFDTYLKIATTVKYRTWRCPVCKEDARYFQLDLIQQQLISKTSRMSHNLKELCFFHDGRIVLKLKEI